MSTPSENLTSEILGLNASQDASPTFAYVPPLNERPRTKAQVAGNLQMRSEALRRDRQIDLDAWSATEQRAKRQCPPCTGDCGQGHACPSRAPVSAPAYWSAIVDVALLIAAVFSVAALATVLGGGA